MGIPVYTDYDKFYELRAKYSPYGGKVPYDLHHNLRFRKNVVMSGYANKENAENLYKMCNRDILFWVNTFVWTYNPKNIFCPELPFICYPFQEEALLNMLECIEIGQDVFTDKSRDMGASWIYLIGITWLWLFKPMMSFLLLSRNEDYVDKSGNPKCLFWKIDYILKKLPKYLKPQFDRIKLHLKNINNGSTVEGESTTSRSGRGDRKTAILMDEFAAVENGLKVLSATADVTDCRIFNSTYEGSGNAFYEVGRWTSTRKLRFHWSQHPDKGRGLYRVKGNIVEYIDTEWHNKNPQYKPYFEHGYYNGLHSPWYDKECKRRTTIEIKEQLDIDPHGSGAMFFDTKLVDDLFDKHTVEPHYVGELDNVNYDNMITPKFYNDDKGHLSLWTNVMNGRIVDQYNDIIISADIASGTGASNSVIVAYDLTSGDKIAEYVNSRIKPYKLARYAMALARFLNDRIEAEQIWEANGPGREYGDEMMDHDYTNLYYKTKDESESKSESDVPGWWSTAENKKSMLGVYRKLLSAGEINNWSKPAISELREMIYNSVGKVVHSGELRTQDPSGAKENHGDRVIADGLAAKRIHEKKVLDFEQNSLDNDFEKEPEYIPPRSPEGRRQEYLNQNKEDGWDG